MKICGIYGIINLVNSKWYIGQGANVFDREYDHFLKLRKGKHSNAHLQAAFNKYGEKNLEFRILESVPEDMLDVRERAWIGYYHSTVDEYGYNLTTGGNRNHHHTRKTKLKMSKAHKGQTISEEHKQKLRDANLGKKHSLETKRKLSISHTNPSKEARRNMSEAHKGKKMPEEQKRKISKAHKGRVKSDAWRHCLSKAAKRQWRKHRKKHGNGRLVTG